MESTLTLRPSQKDDGLGDWHPAQRPDTHKTAEREDRPSEPSKSKEEFPLSSCPVDLLPDPSSSTESLDVGPWPLASEGSQVHYPRDDKSHYGSHTGTNGHTYIAEDSSQQQSLVQERDDDLSDTEQHKRVMEGSTEALLATSADGEDNQPPMLEQPSAEAVPSGLNWHTDHPVYSEVDFAILASVDRTDSFPDVPPIQTSKLPLHSLPRSQAEDILEDNGEDVGIMTGTYSGVSFSRTSLNMCFGTPSTPLKTSTSMIPMPKLQISRA